MGYESIHFLGVGQTNNSVKHLVVFHVAMVFKRLIFFVDLYNTKPLHMRKLLNEELDRLSIEEFRDHFDEVMDIINPAAKYATKY